MDWFTMVGTIVGIGVGFAVQMIPGFKAKATPIVTLIVSILTQVLNALNGNPGPAGALGAVLHTGPIVAAGFFQGEFFKFIANCAIQWFLTTGAHSAPKNTIQFAKGEK